MRKLLERDMSANNFIRIQKTATNKWHVCECDADTGGELHEIASEVTMEEAIRVANKYQDENEVEYGLKIHTD